MLCEVLAILVLLWLAGSANLCHAGRVDPPFADHRAIRFPRGIYDRKYCVMRLTTKFQLNLETRDST